MNIKKVCMDLDYVLGVGVRRVDYFVNYSFIRYVYLYLYSESKEIIKKCIYYFVKNDIIIFENFFD